MTNAYCPKRTARSTFTPLRGLDYHVNVWGDPAHATPEAPLRVMMHGWMDVGASFQFVVDALGGEHPVIAPDWRGFGLSRVPPTDSYWFADYLGDLDALLDAWSPDAPVDLIGHSMGGNVVMMYAGARPQRIRRLDNLEGFGMAATRPEQAPDRMAQWLDELKAPMALRGYASRDEVAERLRRNNPRLAADKAAWLAGHWAAPDAQSRWHLQADVAHKRVNPLLYRADEAVATWRRIAAPVLWVEGSASRPPQAWTEAYPRAEFEARLAAVASLQRVLIDDAGHMLHHDQPEAVAAALRDFLAAP